MLPVIDFRNGRYQGQTRNQLPHGVGFFMDKSFLLCLGEWLAGELSGSAIVIFPSGRVFAGSVAYRQPQGLTLYELPEDHVQLLAVGRGRGGEGERMAAVLPLLRTILEIDNSRSQAARVVSEYEYVESQQQNRGSVARVLGLERGSKELPTFSNFIQFFRDKFLEAYPEALEFIVSEHRGRKEYFLGLRGQGLGVRVQPLEELSAAKKQSGRVYMVRAMGHFTKDNQLRELGLKTLDNPMKGAIIEEGVFSMPATLVRYEHGKRPLNCSVNFHNHIKRSLYYRDKVLETEYLYQLESFVLAFNRNLRVTETERLAQFTIENPNNNANNLVEIERKRREREKETESFYKSREATPPLTNPYNPYTPTEHSLPANEYNLHRLKDEIYRSASKKKGLPIKLRQDYQKVEYTDPNYRLLPREDRERLPFQRIEALEYTRRPTSPLSPLNRPLSPLNRSLSPLDRPKSKSPYQYLYDDVPRLDISIVTPLYNRNLPEPSLRNPTELKRPNRYRSEREVPYSEARDENSRSPFRNTYTPRYPQTEQPAYKSFMQDEPVSRRPKYNYHFPEQHEPGPISPFRR